MFERMSLRESTWLSRLQPAITMAALLGFAAVAIVVVCRTRRIASDVDVVARADLPAVEGLSAARGDLHRLDHLLERYVRDAEVGAARPAMADLRRCEAALDALLDRYASTPPPSLERRSIEDVRALGAQLRQAVGSTVAAVDIADWRAAEGRLAEEQDTCERTDSTLGQLVSFDTAQSERLGLDAAQARRSAVAMMMGLDGAIAALAGVAALLAYAAHSRQVSQLRSTSDEATTRVVGLEERSRELEQFAGRVAHDVLSPLMAVSAGLELSRARLRGDEVATRTLERARRSLTRVQRTVDGLLEFAQAGGAHPPAGASADLREAVQGVVEDVRGEAGARGVTIIVEPFESCSLPCSPGVLTSLVGNLVRNAVKHMGDAPVREVRLRALQADGSVRVEVEDTGPGIDEHLQSTIFEPFVRAGSAAPGAGLGLATVKKLVAAHEGRVGFRSKPGAGSTFWFELPRRR